MNIWQPIVTAPKDGTWFLALSTGKERGARHDKEPIPRVIPVQWHNRAFHKYGDPLTTAIGELTHWMPSPKPPALKTIKFTIPELQKGQDIREWEQNLLDLLEAWREDLVQEARIRERSGKIRTRDERPNGHCSIEIIGNGYLVHNHFKGWVHFYATKAELIENAPEWLADLVDMGVRHDPD